jgi:predicted dehydrogenase
VRFRLLLAAAMTFVAGLACASSWAADEPANSAPLRVGVVGLVHGHVLGFLNNYKNRRDFQIVGVAEADRELSQRYASRFGLDEKLLFATIEQMLDQARPQAVVTYTDTLDHRKVVEACAKRGIHVMMEKPLAVSLDDARAMQRAADEGKIHVLVNYETTWYRSNKAVYDLIHENALGDVRKIVSHFGHRGPKEIGVGPEFLAWLSDPRLNGAGALFDFGCYGAGLAAWIFDGQRPLGVTAVTQQIKPDIYPKVDDEATIILTYPRAQVIIQASWNWPFDRKDMEVYGKSGYAFTVLRDDVRVRKAGEAQDQKIAAKPLSPPMDDPLSYLKAVVNGQIQPQGLSSLQTNVIATEILDAARQSAASGKTVVLPAGK